jgi:hypothetical protein
VRAKASLEDAGPGRDLKDGKIAEQTAVQVRDE